MCSSKAAPMSRRGAMGNFAGSPPTRATAAASVSLFGFFSISCSAVRHPVIPRLPDAGQAEFIRLLGQKIDDFQRMLELDAVLAERAGDGDARDHAGHAVETAARRHRIAVRAHDDRGSRGCLPSRRPMRLPAASTWVARPASRMRSGEPGAPLVEQRREGAPRIGTARLGDGAQRHEVGPEPIGIDAAGHRAPPACGRRNRPWPARFTIFSPS